ncbi:MAG: CPBP family intramembrane metalloprotease [Planctomycetes bacterium]|nr:CPBP family intramembrane metalloprotease [Planctomycetota bacterium]
MSYERPKNPNFDAVDGRSLTSIAAVTPSTDGTTATLARLTESDLLVKCWRCGKSAPAAEARCSICSATLSTTALEPLTRPDHTSGLVRLIWVFGALLLTSLLHAAWAGMSAETTDIAKAWEIFLKNALIIELADTFLVVGAMYWIARPPLGDEPKLHVRVAAWITSIPVLASLLTINLAYHTVLAQYAPAADPSENGEAPTSTALLLLVFCVQPAMVEELFFRHIALGTLQRLANKHTAVFLSAIMFGLAHIGAPLSIPILTVIGIAFGYARLASGGLALPMLMHFAHNAAVLYLNGAL